ncbi:MAG: ammonia permease, partial [Candidatus Omnitrophica bacterium]|nr:ammonia permease [Candidatus Omnitrophota bacterium]
HWVWGGGWLAQKGFLDFAGSTQVHSIGGWAALAGVIALGPRYGKYNKNGSVNPIPGHNLALGLIGCFVLWLGWFGFNPGSTMAADPEAISRICVTTNTAAAAAMLSATVISTMLLGKPDLGMTINGCLAGLVAITAPCAFVSVMSSFIIGLIAGIVVVLAVIGFDKIRIDDPVGALAVHLCNGVFGTLCVGLFAESQWTPGQAAGLFFGGGLKLLSVQFSGIIAVGLFVFFVSAIVWKILKMTMGIRVSVQEEIEGLDIGEHGQTTYPEFVVRKPAYSYVSIAERIAE